MTTSDRPLRIAFLMDPLEGIDIAADTSFVMMLEAQQRGIDGALIQLHQVLRHLLDAARQTVAVKRAHRLERLEDQQIEGPVKQVRSRSRHNLSLSVSRLPEGIPTFP